MKKKAAKKHTGKIRHPDMTTLMDGVGKKDKHASAEHHKANAANAMPLGNNVCGGYGCEQGQDQDNDGDMC